MVDFTAQLCKYMPAQAAPIISMWINDTQCTFRVSRSRATKLGDYRAPYAGAGHKISVNHDLNAYAFLITTIHEFAHLKTWQQHQHLVKPHGTAWKQNFKLLMEPFLTLSIFPEDILRAVERYLNNPAASSCTDINLYRILRTYDKDSTLIHTVETIAPDSMFTIKGGRLFRKGEKQRTRYKCIEVHTKKTYLFHPIAEVYPVKE